MSSDPARPPERTALHAEHVALGATLVDFHGWEMPIRYGNIPDEHRKVRESAGLFDLGHMGRLLVEGPDADAWIQAVITNDVSALALGDARYTLICAEDGTIIDDAIVYRLPESLFIVVNASNRSRVIEWLESHRDGRDARLRDLTPEWGMIAVQGPAAMELARPRFASPSRPWDELRYYQVLSATYRDTPVWIARTGYTGENGVEVYLPAELTPTLWRELLEVGGEAVAAIGLGARDTLRLEAGMPLYGNDIDATTNPYEAGLGFAVKLDVEPGFVGREALRRVRESGPSRRLRGFRVDSRRIARAGMPILCDGAEVGIVTSGAPSPTLGYPIALGYVSSASLEAAGDSARGETSPYEVDLRGRRERLIVQDLPFFSRTRKKNPA